MTDNIIKVIYAGTRPLVTLMGWSALIFIAVSAIIGIGTVEEAEKAASIIGTPVGIITAWWFKSRDQEKANGTG